MPAEKANAAFVHGCYVVSTDFLYQRRYAAPPFTAARLLAYDSQQQLRFSTPIAASVCLAPKWHACGYSPPSQPRTAPAVDSASDLLRDDGKMG